VKAVVEFRSFPFLFVSGGIIPDPFLRPEGLESLATK
jgi:hypothetical protein